MRNTSLRKVTAMALIFFLIAPMPMAWGIGGYSEKGAPTTEGAAPDRLLVKLADDMRTVRSASVLHGAITGMSAFLRLPPKVVAMDKSGTGSAGASWYAATLKTGSDIAAVREELLQSGQVLAVEFDYVRTFTEPLPITVADPFEVRQEHLDFIGAYGAYKQVENPGKGILIAVLDTGVDDKHPDLKDNVSAGGRRYYLSAFGEVDWDKDYKDRNGHGTHIAGIIAATRNGSGVVGIASSALILPVKVLGDTGSGYDSTIAAGIDYAIACKARVINMSFGSIWGTELYTDLALKAREHGCLIVAATGNSAMPTGSVGDSYYSGNITPAGLPYVLAVMAMETTPAENGDYLAPYSNWDSGETKKYQLMAPGTILSTYSNGRYAVMTGTSVAAPVVSGAAAVIMGHEWGISVEEVWDRLVNSADLLQGRSLNGKVYTFGSLNLAKAVETPSGPSKPRLSAEVSLLSAKELVIKGQAMPLDTVHTEGIILADHNGAALSGVRLKIANYSGRAEDIRLEAAGLSLTGEAAEIPNLGIGDSWELEFEITEKLRRKNFELKLSVFYKDGLGDEQEPLILSLDIPVKYAVIPDGLMWNPGGWYSFEAGSVFTLEAGRIWCLDGTLHITRGQSLTLAPGAELLMGPDAAIVVEQGGRFEAKGNADSPVTLHLNTSVVNLGGQALFDHCVLYEPFIEAATRISNCFISGVAHEEVTVELEDEIFMGLLERLVTDGDGEDVSGEPERAVKIEADTIKNTQIIDLWDAELNAREFTYNLVDSCINTKLRAEKITGCTFRENVILCPAIYGAYENLCLVIVTPDHQKDSSEGFYSNCVVGPVKIYSELSETGSKYALISDVYYQGVGALLWGAFSVLYDTDDRIYCAADSELSDKIPPGCPPFVTALTVEGSVYEEDFRRVVTKLRLDFSGRIHPGSEVYCGSFDNPLYTSDAPLPDKIEWSEDGKSCRIDIFVDLNAAMKQNYYLFSGFSPADFPMMRLGLYSAFGEPVSVRFVEEFTVYARDNGEGVLVEWLPPRHEDFSHYSVSRSLDGENYVEIYSNKIERYARNGSRYRFFDIFAEDGVRYYYQIDGYNLSGDNTKMRYASGFSDIIRHTGERAVALEMPEPDSGTAKVLRLFAETPMEFDTISFDIVCDDARMSLMDVSDELWSVFGMPFGVSRIDAVTVRVIGGPGTDCVKVVAGDTLMCLTLRGVNMAESGIVRIENFEAFKEGEPVEIRTGVSFDLFGPSSAAA